MCIRDSSQAVETFVHACFYPRFYLRIGWYTPVSYTHLDKLPSLLLDKHFFIFPSEERREGHSNALTETMCYGIIPIASKAAVSYTHLTIYTLGLDDSEKKVIKKKATKIYNESYFWNFT